MLLPRYDIYAGLHVVQEPVPRTIPVPPRWHRVGACGYFTPEAIRIYRSHSRLLITSSIDSGIATKLRQLLGNAIILITFHGLNFMQYLDFGERPVGYCNWSGRGAQQLINPSLDNKTAMETFQWKETLLHLKKSVGFVPCAYLVGCEHTVCCRQCTDFVLCSHPMFLVSKVIPRDLLKFCLR
jgi:hypothetical protein